ncbi:MAG: type II secretion system protein J [Acidimicrobiia bacterium]
MNAISPSSPRRLDDRGMTLIEMLVTVSVMLTVLFAVFGLFDAFYKASARNDSSVEARSRLRTAGEWVARDVRGASMFTASSSSSQLDVLATADDGSPVYVRWYVSGGSLMRATRLTANGSETSRTVMAAMTTSTPFAYFDSVQNAVTTSDKIAQDSCVSRVRVSLTTTTANDVTVSQTVDAGRRTITPSTSACD